MQKALRPRISRFRLPKGGLVRVAVWQVAPRCGFVGRYAFRAGRGTNLLRLPRRIGKHRLHAGTYHFVGASRGDQVLDTRFRVVRTKHRLLVRHGHLADVCLSVQVARAAGFPFVSSGGAPPTPAPRSAPPVKKTQPGFLPPVLHDLNPANASPLVRAFFFALLACAITLLGAASLPERTSDAWVGGTFVTQHRPELTVTGLTLIVAAALLMGLL
jgi:hypothetical protein